MEDIIIKQAELKKDISEVINKAKLPAFIITPILKDLLEQVSIAEVQQYNKAVEKREKKNKEKSEEK